MAISQFIPKVWSAKLNESLRAALVFGRLCNRNWEGEISQYGDTVHINALSDITVKAYTPNTDIDDPEQLSGTDMTLTIDHAAYFNFYLNDVDAAQAKPHLMEAAMRSAAYKLAEDAETYLKGVMVAGAGTKKTGPLPAGGLYELLVTIKTALDEKNVPRGNRKVVIPPALEAGLLLDNRFISGGLHGHVVLTEGAVGRATGFDIYVSNTLTKEVIALTEEGVTFASQIGKTEAYRREKGFDDGVKGLSLCGAKVVNPPCVYVHTIA